MPWHFDASIPRELTSREGIVLFAMLNICDERTGLVPGGKRALAAVLPRASKLDHLRETLALLEKKHLICRARTRLWVVISPFLRGDKTKCANCDLPTDRNASHCITCRQIFRIDREWQLLVIRMAVKQLATTGKVDALAISIAVKRPLWKGDDDDNQNGAVVPLLIREGFDRTGELRAALKNALGPVEWARLRTQRRKKWKPKEVA